MATTKITDLTAYTDPVNTDVLPIVDVTSDVTKKVSIANVMKNASLGTAAAPAISFDGDPNTGIYSPGADQVAVTTGGTQRLLIDSAGAVTIAGDLTVNGTTTNINTTNLVIEDKNIILGDVTTPTDVTADGGGITLKGTTDKTINWVDSTDAWTSSERFSYPLGSAAAPTLTFTGDANTGIYSPGADQVAISTNGTGRLFVDSSGLVAIGSNSAGGSRLCVHNGSILVRSDGDILKVNDVADTSYWFRMSRNGSNFEISNRQAGSIVFLTSDIERLRLTSTGALNFVGAGTAGSTQAVSFNGSAPINSLVIDSSGNVSSNTNTFFIDRANSRVGLGTSAPQQLLQVGGYSGSNGITIGAGNSSYGLIYFADGTSGTEAYRGYLQYNHATDKLELGSAAATGITIDSSQRVGIGTTSPDGRLHVLQGTTPNIAQLYVGQGGGSNNYYDANNHFFRDGNLNSVITATSSTIQLFTGAAERARIDSSGRLLVGTSSARSNWFNTSYTPQLQLEGISGAGSTISICANTNDNGGSYLVFGKTRGTTVGANTVVASDDSLGQVVFQGSDGTELVTAATITGAVDGTPGANDMPGRLVFSTTADGASSPTERMRISSDGHTYWGVANPGTSAFGTAIGRLGSLGFFQTARNVGGADEVGFFHGNAGEVRIFGDGDLQNTNNSYTGISDSKLKENIVGAGSQWNDLKALEVRKYNFKTETGYNTHTQIGLVAQEVELVSPGLVSESPDRDEDGNDLGTVTKSVNYSVLYMKAVKALQEAMERIETLEAKVAALEAS